MDIQSIKARLTIGEVLRYYGLQPGGNHRMRCPFHDDKTPSLQVYPKTNTCYCFSSNCQRHGKRMDVIDFIQHKEQLTKHQAIEKAKTLVQQTGYTAATPVLPTRRKNPPPAILQQLEKTFLASIWMSQPAKEYCQLRALDISKLKGHIGFNSGQFHHAGRFKKGEEYLQKQLIQDCLQIGMLKALHRTNNRTGAPVTYQVFAKNCLVFFLKNKQHKTVGLYGRSIVSTRAKNKSSAGTSRHFYLTNRQGLYPGYPSKATTHLLLTESIIDCATLQQTTLPKNYSVLALYGTNGFTQEHTEAVSQLPHLKELIFCFDNDDAGKKATAKYTKALQHLNLIFSTLQLPNKDVNEVAQAHESLAVFNQLLSTRTPLTPKQAGTPDVQIHTTNTTPNKTKHPPTH